MSRLERRHAIPHAPNERKMPHATFLPCFSSNDGNRGENLEEPWAVRMLEMLALDAVDDSHVRGTCFQQGNRPALACFGQRCDGVGERRWRLRAHASLMACRGHRAGCA